MEATKRLKAQGLRKGGKAKKQDPLQRRPGRTPKPKGETKSNKTLTPQEKKDLLDKMICKFIKICHEKNIVIKDKEPSFAEELNKKENKHSFFEKIKDIMCCSCCYIA